MSKIRRIAIKVILLVGVTYYSCKRFNFKFTEPTANNFYPVTALVSPVIALVLPGHCTGFTRSLHWVIEVKNFLFRFTQPSTLKY